MKKPLPKCCICQWFKLGPVSLLTGISIDVRCGAQAYQPAQAVFNNLYCRKVYEPIEMEGKESEQSK